MVFTILIAIFVLFGLLILHELSHFFVAKGFGVEVEEFGIGYPPRLFGKKIGQTIYSLNLLPFGAFVKISEEKLRKRPIWQRALILIAGVFSFWIISIVLISIVFSTGALIQVSDEENGNLIDPRVQVIAVLPDSPAKNSGLEIGDIIKEFKVGNSKFKIQKIKQIQELTERYKGKEVILTIERGKKVFDLSIVPRLSPPEGEGPLGVGLIRVAKKKYDFFRAISEAILTTSDLTVKIVLGIFSVLKRLVLREPLEAEIIGPVGILDIFVRAGSLGFVYFLQTVALISLNVAIFNALPIPVVDGGQLAFLALEKIRKKPLNKKVEEKINQIFFAFLVALAIWVTMKDIKKLF